MTRTLSVEILDGDANEQNDTRETATPLTVGTDAAFMVGGFGDEDWFSFEAAPNAGEKKLYTLSFLDLNTDYSDEFFYEVYAPDGTPVVGGARGSTSATSIRSAATNRDSIWCASIPRRQRGRITLHRSMEATMAGRWITSAPRCASA